MPSTLWTCLGEPEGLVSRRLPAACHPGLRWHSLMLGSLGASPATVLPVTHSEDGPRALPACPSTGAARSAGFCRGP